MEWFETKKKLPKLNDVVLVWYDYAINGNAAVCFCEDGKFYLYHSSSSDDEVPMPTHWTCLPAPPNGVSTK